MSEILAGMKKDLVELTVQHLRRLNKLLHYTQVKACPVSLGEKNKFSGKFVKMVQNPRQSKTWFCFLPWLRSICTRSFKFLAILPLTGLCSCIDKARPVQCLSSQLNL